MKTILMMILMILKTIQIFIMSDVSSVRRLQRHTLDYAWIYIENGCQDSSRAHTRGTAFDLFNGKDSTDLIM